MPQVLSNRTIDDQFGDSVTGALPSYSPLSTWNQGANCGGCTLHPDPAPAFNHTWHDNSQPPGDAQAVSVSFDFTGTAVWVFCIVPPVMQNDTITHYILSFDLDNGTHRGNFTHFPTGNEYLYNVPVVSLPSLSNTAHTLSISTDGAVDGSAFLFDYAVYTSVEGEEDAHAQTSTGTIAGIVFGTLVLIILLVLALLRFMVYRKRQQNRKLPPILPVVEPFKADAGNAVSESRTPALSSRPVSSNSPSALVRQLQQALDTVATMRQTAVGSTQGTESGIMMPNSPGSDDTPPPVYQSRASMSKS